MQLAYISGSHEQPVFKRLLQSNQYSSCREERGPPLEISEDVLMACGMEMSSVLAFLHENYPHFVGDDAMQDAAAVSDYFSQAGEYCMLKPKLEISFPIYVL